MGLACALGLSGLVLSAVFGCAVNPVTRRPEITTMSTSSEVSLGHQMALEVQRQMGLLDDPELTAYVSRLGARLAQLSVRQDIAYRFYVVDIPEINAFALPGGHVYVSRGLLGLTVSEAELAGVMGHEIGHVAARHSAQRATRMTGVGILSAMGQIFGGALGGAAGARSLGGLVAATGAGLIASYSREQEQQADELGQQMAGKAGYDPAAISGFLDRMARYAELERGRPELPHFLDSHPPTKRRVEVAAWRAGTIEVTDRATLSATRASYLSELIGLTVGPDPKDGVLIGPRFIHPELGFALDVPAGWQTANRADGVAALSPDGQAVIEVEIQRGSADPTGAARAFAQASGLYLVDQSAATLNGLAAHRARAQAPSDLGIVSLDFHWIAQPEDRVVFRITSASSKDRYPHFEPTFARVAQSFRQPSMRERESIKKRQLWITRARAGENLATLSRRSGNVWSIEQTAIQNELLPDAFLTSGQLIKIAVDLPYR
jgi:predicted Zn-dependent protease